MPQIISFNTIIAGKVINLEKLFLKYLINKKVKPKYNRIVIMDYRNSSNIHAVTPKQNFKL